MRKSRYKSLQLRMQRPFSRGFCFVGSYGYNTQRTQGFFDIQDKYDGKRLLRPFVRDGNRR